MARSLAVAFVVCPKCSKPAQIVGQHIAITPSQMIVIHDSCERANYVVEFAPIITPCLILTLEFIELLFHLGEPVLVAEAKSRLNMIEVLANSLKYVAMPPAFISLTLMVSIVVPVPVTISVLGASGYR